MELELVHSVVDKLALDSLDLEGKEDIIKEFVLDYDVVYVDNDKYSFYVIFNCSVKNTEFFNLEIEYTSIFTTSEEISEDFKTSSFPHVNAPSIAFPFLRACISTVLLNCGYTPAILPSINFIKHHKNKNKNKSKI